MSAPGSSATLPFLRPPPFPDLDRLPQGTKPLPDADIAEAGSATDLFAAVREARVGAEFWAPPCPTHRAPKTVIRPRSKSELFALREQFDSEETFWVAGERGLARVPSLDSGADVDPWSLLPHAERLVAHGDDEWVVAARIVGLPVFLLSSGRFGLQDDEPSALDEKAFQALAHPMRDPFGDGWLKPLEVVSLLAEWRRVIEANRGGPGQSIVVACGMSWWKRAEIRRFLWLPESRLQFTRSARRALAIARRRGGALAVWPSRISPALVASAGKQEVPLVRVEDGFVRSAGLGSNLVPPSSVVVDRSGIHFDPDRASDLETILATAEFSSALVERAKLLREAIVAGRISKYAKGTANEHAPRPEGAQRVVLVPGQVENDMSVLAGGAGLASNLELLRRTRALEPKAEIWWRPHPDVEAGHRIGSVPDEAALQYADRIVREDSMADLLGRVDALHVLTSLSGFEALLRGREVTCHGTPFFAGWGLTRDLADIPDRRGRKLGLDELVAGVLLLYPRYLDPVTGLPCPPEVLIRRMTKDEMPNRQQWIEPVRRLQGKFATRFRSRPIKGRSA